MEDAEKESCHTIPETSPWQQILNYLAANFWIGPLVVIYWASTWYLITSVLIYPNDTYASIWVSFGISVGFCFLASCGQELLYKLSNRHGVVCSVVVSCLYTYVMAFASVNQWVCVWNGWEYYTSSTIYHGLGTYFGSFLALALLRCCSQVLAPPCTVAVDLPVDFVTTTYFNTKPSDYKHILDSLFSITVIAFLVAMVWKGLWIILDHNDITRSGLYCLVIAWILEGTLLLIKPWLARLSAWSDNRHWLMKYCVEDLCILQQHIMAVLYWRGIWLLYEKDFLPPHLRYWLGHSICFLLLTISFASRSLLIIGCCHDGVRDKGQMVILDIQFVTNLMSYWRRDKYITLDKDVATISTPSSNSSGRPTHTNDEKQSVVNASADK